MSVSLHYIGVRHVHPQQGLYWHAHQVLLALVASSCRSCFSVWLHIYDLHTKPAQCHFLTGSTSVFNKAVSSVHFENLANNSQEMVCTLQATAAPFQTAR